MTALTAIRQSQGNMLRIHGNGEVPVEEVYKFLQALEHAYNSAYVFDLIATQAAEFLERYDNRPPIPARNLLWMGWWPPTPEKVAAMVPPADKLILAGVELHSPGDWDFLGKLNPLETIRQYLNDRHQRELDWAYRAEAEARKLELENQLLENQVIQKRIELIKSLGATDHDLALLKEQLLLRPLQQLNQFQDQAQITSAEIVESESKKKRA